MEVVRVCSSKIEADVLCALLESHGIQAIVQADDGMGTHPHMQLTVGVRLLVPTEQVAKALEILEAEPA